MRLLIIFITFFSFYSISISQEQTLFSDQKSSGGFGGPVIKVTSVRDQAALFIGGRGGWIYGHSFIIGGGLYGTLTEVDAAENAMPVEGPLDISLGYGGLELEYIFNSHQLIHYNFYILIGAGVAKYVKDVGPVFESNEQAGESDLVFALEPAVSAEMNITEWLRIGAGVSYRLITGVNQPGIENNELSGITGKLTFKYGNF